MAVASGPLLWLVGFVSLTSLCIGIYLSDVVPDWFWTFPPIGLLIIALGSWARAAGPWEGRLLPLFVFFAGFAIAGMGLRLAIHTTTWLWATTFIGLVLTALAAGRLVQGRWRSLFVNRRNRWSLSQTQAVAWTLLVLAGFTSYWWVRHLGGDSNPASLFVDDRLWQLMGLTTGTLGVAAFIHSRQGENSNLKPEQLESFETSDLRWRFHHYKCAFDKAMKDTTPAKFLENHGIGKHKLGSGAKSKTLSRPPPRPAVKSVKEVQDALRTTDVGRRAKNIKDLLNRSEGEEVEAFMVFVSEQLNRIRPASNLVRNLETENAHPAEMFQSELVGNAHRTDIGKVQMFLVSLVAMMTFTLDTIRPLIDGDCTAACFDSLPLLNPGLFLVLTGSSVGYLAMKAIPQPLESWKDKPLTS